MGVADQAESRLRKLGYDNVKVLVGDGTPGWPEHAPYDAIVVTAGGPEAPRSLIEQLGAVPFVLLIGEEGWQEAEGEISPRRKVDRVHRPEPLAERIERAATHIPDIQSVNLDRLMARIGDARLVLLGEANHGTAEFYEMRARITRDLIQRKGFNFIAVEADWPDAAQIDHFIRGTRLEPTEEPTFSRFPTWMWTNAQVLELAKWPRDYYRRFASPDEAVGFYGLDLYSMYSSIDSVIRYLDEVDEEAAAIARRRYGCLTPWQKDPATYGAMALTRASETCEKKVVAPLHASLRFSSWCTVPGTGTMAAYWIVLRYQFTQRSVAASKLENGPGSKNREFTPF